jgi:hypothetical protein
MSTRMADLYVDGDTTHRSASQVGDCIMNDCIDVQAVEHVPISSITASGMTAPFSLQWEVHE